MHHGMHKCDPSIDINKTKIAYCAGSLCHIGGWHLRNEMDRDQIPSPWRNKPAQLNTANQGELVKIHLIAGFPSAILKTSATKMIEKTDNVPYQIGRKIYLFISIVNIHVGPHFEYLPKGCLYFFMLSVFYILQPF